MDANTYTYDVAFSFTYQDESLATRLFQLLSGRIKCFLYSEAQKDIAGKDGEIAFNSVFGKESRIVVILYRNEWGNTKWTKIEETAIRNRAYNEGYDFVLLVPVVAAASIPQWFPKTRLWIGYERWGIEGVASVIEARVQEAGGAVRKTNIGDIAAASENEILAAKKRRENINYENCKLELQKLKPNIETQIRLLKDKVPQWIVEVKQNDSDGWTVYCNGFKLAFLWHQTYANLLNEAWLDVYLVNRTGDEHVWPIDQQRKEWRRYVFHINEIDEYGWQERRQDFPKMRFFATPKLVEHWIEKFVSWIIEKRQKM